MFPTLRSFLTALWLVAGGLAAHAQQGGKRLEDAGSRPKHDERVSARVLREDERAERTKTVRADGRMHEKPRFIREEDRRDHRKHPSRASVPAAPRRAKGHTTLKG